MVAFATLRLVNMADIGAPTLRVLKTFVASVDKDRTCYKSGLSFFKDYCEDEAKFGRRRGARARARPAEHGHAEHGHEHDGCCGHEKKEKKAGGCCDHDHGHAEEHGHEHGHADEEPDEPDPELMTPDTDPPAEMGPDAAGELSDADHEKVAGMKSAAAESLSNGEYAKAVEAFTAVLKLSPSPLVYAKRADAFLKLKKPNAALRDCAKALESNPDSAKALKIRGWQSVPRRLRGRAEGPGDGAADRLRRRHRRHQVRQRPRRRQDGEEGRTPQVGGGGGGGPSRGQVRGAEGGRHRPPPPGMGGGMPGMGGMPGWAAGYPRGWRTPRRR